MDDEAVTSAWSSTLATNLTLAKLVGVEGVEEMLARNCSIAIARMQ
jgi:hypothetical protein